MAQTAVGKDVNQLNVMNHKKIQIKLQFGKNGIIKMLTQVMFNIDMKMDLLISLVNLLHHHLKLFH